MGPAIAEAVFIRGPQNTIEIRHYFTKIFLSVLDTFQFLRTITGAGLAGKRGKKGTLNSYK